MSLNTVTCSLFCFSIHPEAILYAIHCNTPFIRMLVQEKSNRIIIVPNQGHYYYQLTNEQTNKPTRLHTKIK